MRERIRKGNEIAKRHLDKKLRRRMIMYFIMSVIILGVVVYEIIITSLSRRLAVTAIIIGLGIGLASHRMFKIYRHEDEEKIMSRIDTTGGIILAVYILFSIFRQRIISEFFQGPTVLAVTMCAVLGMMTGRVIGMSRKIRKVLKEQEILG